MDPWVSQHSDLEYYFFQKSRQHRFLGTLSQRFGTVGDADHLGTLSQHFGTAGDADHLAWKAREMYSHYELVMCLEYNG